MTTKTCAPRFPTPFHLALATTATAALVLFLAGWGTAFWVLATTALATIALAVVRHLRRPRAHDAVCTPDARSSPAEPGPQS